MNNTETELNNMIAQANAVVSEVKEPIGYPGWWSQQHLFSMIAAISTIFNIDVEKDVLSKIINATNDIGMTKYRIKIRLARLLNPAQVALFNGVMFPEAAKQRTKTLGFAYIKLCKSIKLGELDVSEIASDKGLRIIQTEFKRQLRKPRPD